MKNTFRAFLTLGKIVKIRSVFEKDCLVSGHCSWIEKLPPLLLYVYDLINYDDLNFNDKKSISKQMELGIFLCVC